ncbi:MAG: cation:proton antiporter [Acetobacteraceae bacterium]
MGTFDIGACLLVLAAGIGLANDRWFGIPRNMALLIGALLTACLVILLDTSVFSGRGAEYWRDRIQRAQLSNVLLEGVLALMLFASSMHVNLRELRDRAGSVALLATVGVILSTLLFGLGFYALALLSGHAVPLIWCFVLGAILAPTDAVVVEGLLRRVRIPAFLRATISGESLFNDGAAVVLFLAALAFAAGNPDVVGHGRLAMRIAKEVIGGALLGWLAGVAALYVVRGIKDCTLEVIVSLALALGAYRVAAAFDVSGPIAVVAAGLAFHAPRHNTEGAQLTIAWNVIDDVLNTFLFLMMGFQLLAVNEGVVPLLLLPFAFLLALLARALSVSVPILLLRLSSREKARGVAVLTWTGLRGGISIALAITLPASPYRELLLAVGYGVVISTILVQGLSVGRVLTLLYPHAPTRAPRPPAHPPG